MRIVTRNSETASFSTTTVCSEIHALLMLRTVSAAFATPVFTASSKLVGDDAVISITLTTLIATSSVVALGWILLPGVRAGQPGKHVRSAPVRSSGEPCSRRWAGSAWRAEVERWIRETLDGLGIAVTGSIAQPRVSPWSTQLTVETDCGLLWLKENCPGQAFEARLLELLAALVPDAVVAPLAIDAERGWFLTPDHGPTLSDRAGDVDLWGEVVSQWADVQRRLLPHLDSLVRAGLTVMAPAGAGAYAARRIGALDALPPDDPAHLAEEDAGRLRALLPEIERWGAALTEGPVPLGLDHNDLHANNAFVPRAGETHLRFFDLGDALVSHPFCSLLVPLNVLSYALEAEPDDPRLWRVVDAYLAVWSDVADPGTLRALVTPALRLARLGRHESWRRVLTTVSEEERAEHGRLEPLWLTMLLEPPPISG